MKTLTFRYPNDILFCLLYSLVLIPFIFLDINDILQMILGLPFLLFIPGYLFFLAVVPSHSAKSDIDAIHIIAISIGLSIALVSLDGILLFFTPLGFTLLSIVSSLELVVLICGIVALYRKRKLPHQNQVSLPLSKPLLEVHSRGDKILLAILFLAIMMTIFTAVFISFLPTRQESFTEFYILDESGKVYNYPKNITVAQDTTFTLGLINQEHKTMDYTIEIWLVNQTQTFNNTTQTMDYVYHEMWFLNKITTTLDHFTPGEDIIWQPQWEYNYTLNINKSGLKVVGRYTVMFLLFTIPAPDYETDVNYKDIAQSEIQNSYASTYIWLNISEKHKKP
jgi:uncharacterized membrane protein